MSAPQLTLAGKPVGRMGFGLMQLTWTPEPKSDEVSFAAMKAAADAGATAWSTAMFYGNPGHHTANIELIRRFFDKYPEYEDKIVLVVKGGIDESFSFPKENAIEYSRQELKRCQQLLGSKMIDVYTISRVYKDVEEIFREVKVLYDEGLFGAVGASEITAEALEKAHKIVPISVIEIEVSLWSYEQEIKDAIKWSTENKVPIFAYSPLGRGFITRTFKSPEDIPEGSFQKHCPRFQGEAFYDNLKLVDELDKLAEEKGLKTPQLALAWVCGLNPYMIPIPGSSDPERVKSNTRAADIKLTDKDLQGINDILANFEVKGGRYPESHSAVLMENQ